MEAYRGFLVWGIGVIVVLGAFLGFKLKGWPGDINSCVWGGATPQSLTSASIGKRKEQGKGEAPKKDEKGAAHARGPEGTSSNASAEGLSPSEISVLQTAVNSGTELSVGGVSIKGSTNTCYCEAFSVSDAASHKGGVRQPVNTWFNLYSIGTSFVVALFVCFDRNQGGYPNLIRSNTWIPDLYIFAVLFLGLGSMWFHGSVKEWGGIFDDLSMYTFAAFLVFYTIRRWWESDLFFWIAYPLTVVGFTIVGEILSQASPSTPVSLFLILALVVAYSTLEFLIWSRDGTDSRLRNWWNHVKWWGAGNKTSWRWWSAVGSIVAAAIFWGLSQTGAPLCDPKGWFQPHGLLWHPLAGVMAVFIYFYWRWDAIVVLPFSSAT